MAEELQKHPTSRKKMELKLYLCMSYPRGKKNRTEDGFFYCQKKRNHHSIHLTQYRENISKTRAEPMQSPDAEPGRKRV